MDLHATACISFGKILNCTEAPNIMAASESIVPSLSVGPPERLKQGRRLYILVEAEAETRVDLIKGWDAGRKEIGGTLRGV